MGQYMAEQDHWKLHSCDCMPTNGTAKIWKKILAPILNASCMLGMIDWGGEVGTNGSCNARPTKVERLTIICRGPTLVHPLGTPRQREYPPYAFTLFLARAGWIKGLLRFCLITSPFELLPCRLDRIKVANRPIIIEDKNENLRFCCCQEQQTSSGIPFSHHLSDSDKSWSLYYGTNSTTSKLFEREVFREVERFENTDIS
jgi:hypothetical protein